MAPVPLAQPRRPHRILFWGLCRRRGCKSSASSQAPCPHRFLYEDCAFRGFACKCAGASPFSPRGGGQQKPTNRRGGTSPQSHALLSWPLSVLLAEQQTVTTAAITANEWLAGRHDAHLPSHQRLASPLLGSWRSWRWLCSAAPPPAILAPRRHAGARACVFLLVVTFSPSASCGLPPIDDAGVELFAGYGSMSYCWRHFGFPIAGLAENAASMQRTIRRGAFPESVVIQDANAVDAAALQPAGSSDNGGSSSRKLVARCVASERPAVKVASVYGGIPFQPIAPSGAERGVDDPRIGDTTNALPRAARALDANSADAENHANIITINGGAVLARLTANFGPDYELGQRPTAREGCHHPNGGTQG